MRAFEPKGEMSQRDAALTVFRSLDPGKWISHQDFMDRLDELTGYQILDSSAKSAARAAQETLAAQREVVIEWYMGGWKRQTAEGQIAGVEKRLKRAGRAVKRTIKFGTAALANPEIDGPERHRLQQITSSQFKLAELESRRASRYRPE